MRYGRHHYAREASTFYSGCGMMALPAKTVFLIPAYNEADCIEALLAELRDAYAGVPACVIDDGSEDATAARVQAVGATVLRLPCNLGVGGAMQAGFRYAWERGFDYAIRLDGDGQHPPAECGRLAERMARGDLDMVVGSRFLGDRSYTSTWPRQLGIRGLAVALSLACRRRITDPTSGSQMVNRAVLRYFAHNYPVDYPEPEALALLSRQGYRVGEAPVAFRARAGGVSSISNWGTVYYLFKVGVALLVDRCRAVDPRFDRANVENARGPDGV